MVETGGSGGSGAGGKWIDLGPLPDRVRRLASFWGGSVSGAQSLYTLASTDGWTQDPVALRTEIRRIQDHRARDELLAWLNGKRT
jgi:hypothetical protein